MPDKAYNVNVQFNLSRELFDDVNRISAEHQLSLKEFTIASLGLLFAASQNNFSPQRTCLYIPNGEDIPVPSLRPPSTEERWPSPIRVSLAPHMYDPLAEYAMEEAHRIQERGRQAYRFGCFVLSHVSPAEGDPVMFWHHNRRHDVAELIGIPFRTTQ